MLRILIKFGYIGWLYTGYQTGNGQNSVEDSIIGVLSKHGISDSIHSAARTDRGVSAISNAFTADTDERPSKVLGLLNSSIDGMLFHSYANVPEGFNPRHCDYKIYRYMLNEAEAGPYLKYELQKFRGKHDFRYFCKLDERNPLRTIRSIQVHRKNGIITVDFKSRSFLWNQIRTIMAYAVENSFARNENDPFEREERFGRMLLPEPLILLEMIYPDILFSNALTQSKKRQFSSIIRESSIRNSIMGVFGNLL